MLCILVSNGSFLKDDGFVDVQVAWGNIMLGDKWLLFVDDFVNTNVGVEVGFSVLEDDDGTIGASTATSISSILGHQNNQRCVPVRADTNRIVERPV